MFFYLNLNDFDFINGIFDWQMGWTVVGSNTDLNFTFFLSESASTCAK